MEALKNFTKKFPFLVGILMLVYIWCVVQYTPSIDGEFGEAIKEFLIMAGSVILALLFVGSRLFTPSMNGIKYCLKKSVWFIIIYIGIIGLGILLVSIASQINLGNEPDIIKPFFIALIFSISVGIVEELVFRTFLFGGLVAKMGKSKAGVIGAAVISALIFGFIHVVSDVMAGGFFDVSTSLSIIGKTLQSGILGYLCAAVYLKTRNFWYIAILHAVNDFFIMWGASIGNFSIGNYANGGNSAFYFALLIVSIPVLITSTKVLLSVELPQEGPLVDDNFLPCTPVEPKKEKKSKKAKA